MKRNYVVFGLGRFGSAVATELSNHGAHVMVVERDEDKINAISSSVTVAVQADVRNKNAIENLGLDQFDGAIVSMAENLESGIMAIMLSKKAGIKQIWAKAKDDFQAEILRAVGATKIIIPEREHATAIARSISSGLSLDLVELSDRVDMVRIPVPSGWVGKSLIDIAPRNKYGINVIAIERNGVVDPDIDPHALFTDDAVIFFVANRKSAKKFFKDFE